MSAQKKNLIFSANYLSIPMILYLIDKKIEQEEIILLVDESNIHKLFCYLNTSCWNSKLEIYYYSFKEHFQNDRHSSIKNKIINSIKMKMLLKSVYNTFLQYKKSFNVYFFSRNYTVEMIYYINKLVVNNKIYFYDIHSKVENGSSVQFFKLTLKEKLNLIRLKLIYGWELEYKSDKTMIFPHISDNIFKHDIKCLELDQSEQEEINKVQMKYKNLFLLNSQMIFFDQPLLDDFNFVDHQAFKEFNLILESLFEDCFDIGYYVKYHPLSRSTNIKNRSKDQNNLQFIPGEWCFNQNTRYYISYCSTALLADIKDMEFEASIIRIALLDMLPLTNDAFRQVNVDYLQARCKETIKIYLPRNLKELKYLLTIPKGQAVSDIPYITSA